MRALPSGNPARTSRRRCCKGIPRPIVGLAVSPDGKTLASASWDNTARLWPLGGGTPRVLEGHQQNVNGVAFTPDGRAVVTAGYDLTLRIWPLSDGGSPKIVTLPTPLNSVVVAPGRGHHRSRRHRQGLFPVGRWRAAGRGRGRRCADHRARRVARRQARRRLQHSRRRRDHRAWQPQPGAHAGRPRAAGVVGGVPARQPHPAHGRHRSPDPPLECVDRRAPGRSGDERTSRSAGCLRGRSWRAGVSGRAWPATR